jgi:hypothetical protein
VRRDDDDPGTRSVDVADAKVSFERFVPREISE